MRKCSLRLVFFAAYLPCVLSAEPTTPAWGLARSWSGDIIFSDVWHNDGTIWRYSEEDGLVKWVTGVKSYFITVDNRDRLWGTHFEKMTRREGYERSLWFIDRKGNSQFMVPPTDDPEIFSGVNFAVDPAGHVLYDYDEQIFRRTENRHELFSHLKFKRITALKMHRDNLYIADSGQEGGSLFAMDGNGNAARIASGILADTASSAHLLGLFVDPSENVYVADMSGRRIAKITRTGQISHVYQSEPPWYPLAGLVDDSGIYILEATQSDSLGNRGPRVVHYFRGIREVVTDADDYREIREYSGRSMFDFGKVNIWVLLLISLMILGILLALLRIILGK